MKLRIVDKGADYDDRYVLEEVMNSNNEGETAVVMAKSNKKEEFLNLVNYVNTMEKFICDVVIGTKEVPLLIYENQGWINDIGGI